ncbi:MAG TPA: substrate-binding domain-containing protein [Gaiellaceae bacterium]|nr:substrate-binding domain-containing protein [Gaiellaceae bacterium]
MKARLLLLAVGALAAAGAAGAGGLRGTSPAARGSAGAAPVRIVYVNNASSAGPFAAVIRNGFEAACRLYEVDCSYRSTTNRTFDPAEEARLIDRAVAEKPDGLMVTDSSPKALNPHIRAAVLAGIPVIIDNTGAGQAGAPTGALTYVGNDERESGRLAGDLLAGAGVKRLLVIAVEPGLELADQRLAGLRQGFRRAGKLTTIRVALADLADAGRVRRLIDGALRRDRAIDGVFSIGQLFNAPMLAERAALGSRATRIRWASVDLGPEAVAALRRGQMEFALDQQQWLQGYLPVEFLAFYVRYGFTPPTPFVRTGPSVVTPRTIGKYVAALRNGMR